MKKLLIIVFLSFAFVGQAHAAIAFDATSTASQAAASSVTLSHTTSGTNRLLIVNVDRDNVASDAVNGVSYAGVQMTKQGFTGNVTCCSVSVWYLINPAVGTNNIVASSSDALITRVGAISYNGVSQSGFPDANGTGSPQYHSTTNGLFAGDTATVADKAWAVLILAKNGGTVPSAGANTIMRMNNASQTNIFDSGVISPAQTWTLNVNTGANNKSVGVYFSFAPAAAASTPATAQNIFLFQ